MAVIQYAGNRFTGLAADTKPDNIPDGALFTELDGDKITYIREGGQWVEYIGETIEAVNSIEIDDGELQLVGDEESPGNNKVYGTNGSGVKGWKDDPAGGGGSVETETATSYTLTLGDSDKYKRFNNTSEITITIPLNSSVAFPIGTVIDIEQMGIGQITVVGSSGVTINSFEGEKSAGQYWVMGLKKVGTDVWTLIAGTDE
jgi:hypothetical protein